MKAKCLFVVCVAVVSVLLGQSIGEKQSKMSRLRNAKMDEVTTGDGFEYFSGYLDTNEIPSNFPTIYLHRTGAAPELKIIGNKLNMEFPVSKLDEALNVYKGLVLAKVATDQKELEAIYQRLKTK